MKISIKEITLKTVRHLFFNDIIHIENFDSNNIKIDEKSYKNIRIYSSVYVTIKKDVKIQSINPWYFIFSKVNGYFEKVNGNKYLRLVPTNKSKEKIKKNEELLIKVTDLISPKTKSFDDYNEKYMKTKFDSDHNLP